MIVSTDQLSNALDVCRHQIARSAFASDELANAGWPKLASQGPDTLGYVMTAYRHPANMLMVMLAHDPTKSDTCVVMAPNGTDISPENAGKLADALFGQRRNGHLQIDAGDVQQAAMSGAARDRAAGGLVDGGSTPAYFTHILCECGEWA